MKRAIWVAAAVVAGTALIPACGDMVEAPVPPVPGTLQVTLASPAAEDGAIMLTLTGADITDIRVIDPTLQIFTREASSTATTVVIVGDLVPGPLFEFSVADVGKLDEYGAVITQVATRENRLRALPLQGYELSIAAQ